MAQPTDLTGMLTEGLFQPTQQAVPSSLAEASMRLAQSAGTGLRRGVGALTGADTRTNPEAARAAMQGLDINNPADQPKILEIVRKYAPEREAQVTAAMSQSSRERALTEQTMALKERQVAADELRAATSGRSSSPFQFGASKTYKDSEGNYYLGTQKRTVGTGEVETVLSPVAGAPAKPQGDVEEVGAYGQTEMMKGNRMKSVSSDEDPKTTSSIQESTFVPTKVMQDEDTAMAQVSAKRAPTSGGSGSLVTGGNKTIDTASQTKSKEEAMAKAAGSVKKSDGSYDISSWYNKGGAVTKKGLGTRSTKKKTPKTKK